MNDREQQLLDFYRNRGRDHAGRTHEQILAWTDAALEEVHDYIQWLFPLPEPSGANPRAPLLTPRVAAAFAESAPMRERLRAAWLRMLAFYGFVLEREGMVGKGPLFATRAATWLTPGNHNHLRLSRILRCLRLNGLSRESETLFATLALIYEQEERGGVRRITPETFAYWQRSLG